MSNIDLSGLSPEEIEDVCGLHQDAIDRMVEEYLLITGAIETPLMLELVENYEENDTF